MIPDREVPPERDYIPWEPRYKGSEQLVIPDLQQDIISGLRHQDPAAFKALERDEAKLKARIWSIRTAIVEKAEALWRDGKHQSEAWRVAIRTIAYGQEED